MLRREDRFRVPDHSSASHDHRLNKRKAQYLNINVYFGFWAAVATSLAWATSSSN